MRMPRKPRNWRRRRRILAVIALFYLVVITVGGCADRFILWPSREYRDAGPAKRLMIRSNNSGVEVWAARSPSLADGKQPQGYVLEFTGNATRAEEIAQFVAGRWKRHPVEAWVMNYPGYGGSEGAAHLRDIPPAALATYDHLKSLAGDKPIFVEANSLGTVAALYVAAQRPVAGLVLQNPPPLHRLIIQHYGWWNGWLAALPVALQIPNQLDSLANAPQVHAPAIFLMADHDTLVPPFYQRLVLYAYAGPKQVIDMPGSTHWSSVTGDAEEQLSRAIDRLWDEAIIATTRPTH